MQIEKRTLNWLPRQSAYDEAVSLRAKRKAAAEDFISTQSTLADTFSGLQSDAVSGLGDIVARAAQARISQASADQAAALQQQLGSLVDTSA